MTSSTAMRDKTVLVTGATSGIGLETARALARMGALVLVGARDAARGQAVVDEMRAGGGQAELTTVNLASFASIRAAAAALLAAHPALDVLVNNAGMASRRRELSPDGHELTWATNFLGPFLLTRLLLPALRRAPAGRVVNVSSVGHKSGRLEWDNLELDRGFATFRAYGNSKLALNLFTRELARREPGIFANAVHPGGIATNIWRSAPAVARWILEKVLPSAEVGAQPVVRLASDPAVSKISGRYFDKLREAEPSAAAQDDAAAARLWDIAEKATSKS
ncbi:MAG: SDR family NAD(P)-dependent oxidoreductase [Acidobacteriota bacterium]|nr:SDR family NAD(P)-dependent oxidoreductase [Acidobacteriota bacterium]